jgi:hypothetical protein
MTDMSEPAGRVGLRDLLNAWDPIGVADLVSDEYDCLIDPLLHKLSAGDSQADISQYLQTQLADHFGLDPDLRDVGSTAKTCHLVGGAQSKLTGPISRPSPGRAGRRRRR